MSNVFWRSKEYSKLPAGGWQTIFQLTARTILIITELRSLLDNNNGEGEERNTGDDDDDGDGYEEEEEDEQD